MMEEDLIMAQKDDKLIFEQGTFLNWDHCNISSKITAPLF